MNWLRIVQNWSTGLRNNVARRAQGEEMCTELLRKTREFLVFASSPFWQGEENKEDSAYGQALFQTHMTRKRALFEATLWSGRVFFRFSEFRFAFFFALAKIALLRFFQKKFAVCRYFSPFFRFRFASLFFRKYLFASLRFRYLILAKIYMPGLNQF